MIFTKTEIFFHDLGENKKNNMKILFFMKTNHFLPKLKISTNTKEYWWFWRLKSRKSWFSVIFTYFHEISTLCGKVRISWEIQKMMLCQKWQLFAPPRPAGPRGRPPTADIHDFMDIMISMISWYHGYHDIHDVHGYHGYHDIMDIIHRIASRQIPTPPPAEEEILKDLGPREGGWGWGGGQVKILM